MAVCLSDDFSCMKSKRIEAYGVTPIPPPISTATSKWCQSYMKIKFIKLFWNRKKTFLFEKMLILA